ncbi:uncharacterized protein DKFZp434B061-like [Haliotis rubra]|uniref:uncharacterized protein DKFZp434B061-like n=1 Tax=Haliotis rubra TaxID=36100 RepID=UPI001EE51174|nr:uncharacterized protein DKFZp434B061-like [Haliotis rubra]
MQTESPARYRQPQNRAKQRARQIQTATGSQNSQTESPPDTAKTDRYEQTTARYRHTGSQSQTDRAKQTARQIARYRQPQIQSQTERADKQRAQTARQIQTTTDNHSQLNRAAKTEPNREPARQRATDNHRQSQTESPPDKQSQTESPPDTDQLKQPDRYRQPQAAKRAEPNRAKQTVRQIQTDQTAAKTEPNRASPLDSPDRRHRSSPPDTAAKQRARQIQTTTGSQTEPNREPARYRCQIQTATGSQTDRRPR